MSLVQEDLEDPLATLVQSLVPEFPPDQIRVTQSNLVIHVVGNNGNVATVARINDSLLHLDLKSIDLELDASDVSDKHLLSALLRSFLEDSLEFRHQEIFGREVDRWVEYRDRGEVFRLPNQRFIHRLLGKFFTGPLKQ